MQYSLLLILLLFAFGCSTPAETAGTSSTMAPATAAEPAATAQTYAGDWDVKVSDTPSGTVTGMLSLVENAEGLSGEFTAGGQTTKLRSVAKTDDGLVIQFYSSEYQTDIDIRLKGEADAPTLTGSTLGTYATVATRKM